MQKAQIDSMGTFLDSKDVAALLGISYIKALKLVRYHMNHIKIGRVYRVSKQNFLQFAHCDKPMQIELD